MVAVVDPSHEVIMPFLTLTLLATLPLGQALDRCVAPPPSASESVPVEFADGRFFASWAPHGAAKLRFYLDTGGPRDQLFSATVLRLGLARQVEAVDGDSVSWVRLPAPLATQLVPGLRSNTWMEPPHTDDGSVRLMASFPGGQLEQMASEGPGGAQVDGILGPDWFGGRVWLLDYAAGSIGYRESGEIDSLPAKCWVPLGFQTSKAGERTSNFPRIVAEVDGDSVDFLVDTGAMTTLTDHALAVVAPGGHRTIATSFIVRSRFDRWQSRHPDWPVVSEADENYHNRMIRVPAIVVGGQRLGPVWFSERPDRAFHEFMSQWMDRRIDGALGGSAWQQAVLVLDYPNAQAAVLEHGGK
ncbi:MAG: hypothetical protein MNPFHGCM_00023 [Gemmatimonadaceae bacterium]|nr:hypothetical protein [Gemmatimonadaceae bacterium]